MLLKTPIVTSGPSYVSPTRETIDRKVLLMITSDCDTFTYLEITGARDAAMIKEKMFSRVSRADRGSAGLLNDIYMFSYKSRTTSSPISLFIGLK